MFSFFELLMHLVSAVNGAPCVTDEFGNQREIFMMELDYSFFLQSNLKTEVAA